jgi:hypothetical protein
MNYLVFTLVLDSILGLTCLPVKKIGKFCSSDSECSSGWCFEEQCTNPPAKNKPCAPDHRCAKGLGCSAKLDGICEPVAKANQPCQFSSTGKNYCDIGLLCYDGICQAAKPALSACSDDKKCGPNKRCKYNRWQKKYVCQLKKARGSFCWRNTECQDGYYCKNLNCRPKKAVNDVCSSGQCAKHLDCLSNSSIFNQVYKPHMCQPIPGRGQHCNLHCKEGYYCGEELDSFWALFK